MRGFGNGSVDIYEVSKLTLTLCAVNLKRAILRHIKPMYIHRISITFFLNVKPQSFKSYLFTRLK